MNPGSIVPAEITHNPDTPAESSGEGMLNETVKKANTKIVDKQK
jgi:hypothetical protein